MGKYEVTQEQWKAVMGEENNPSNTKGEKRPVTNVSWEDCQDFIKKLNEKNKGKYRLPTEAEWEYACRAGTTTVYSFGDEITTNDANYDDPMKGLPVAVGGYKPNAFGIYDMHGNVWEWCNDRYDSLQNGAVKDPNGPAIGETHVMRGGSFSESNARSSSRTYGLAPFRWNNDGFRLAKDTSVRKP